MLLADFPIFTGHIVAKHITIIVVNDKTGAYKNWVNPMGH